MIRSRAMAGRRLLLASVALAILLGIAAQGSAGLGGALLYLLPPLVLLLALATRRYPGERALLALMGRSRHRRRHAPADGARPRLRPRVLVPRGGRLIASSLAVRPPPTPAVVSLT